MIRSLIKYLPPLTQLKKELKNNPELLDSYLGTEILRGDAESVEYILELKQQLDNTNDKSN